MALKNQEKKKDVSFHPAETLANRSRKTFALLDEFAHQGKPGKELGLKVTANRKLEEMQEAFRQALLSPEYLSDLGVYDEILFIAKRLQCKSKDITAFSLAVLPKFEKTARFSEMAGLFISAIINTRKEKDFLIDLSWAGTPIRYIGYRNAKNIVVKCETSDDAGQSMEVGSIEIFGNARWLGSGMKDGKIILHGNATTVGNGMSGGEIIVNGNIESTGIISGGRVVVNGNITAFVEHSLLFGGDIFQFDRQLMAKGKLIAKPENL